MLTRRFLALTLTLICLVSAVALAGCKFTPPEVTLPSLPSPEATPSLPAVTTPPAATTLAAPPAPLVTRVEIITPFSDAPVSLEANGQTYPLTRVNEIYATGLVPLTAGDAYTILMDGQSKQGVFNGGYRGYLAEAQKTGYYPFSGQPLSGELADVEEMLFDYLPLPGTGRAMVKGFYTGAGGNSQMMRDATFAAAARQTFPVMQAAGANWVNIVPMWFFFPHDDDSHTASSELRPVYREEFYGGLQGDGYNYPTFTDEELTTFIADAHAAGLKVYLVPHITPANWGPATTAGKATLVVDDVDTFFQNYEAMITHYARLAEATGVELLGIGCENDSLTIMEQNIYPGVDLNRKWYDIIAAARAEYGGKLTYSAAAGSLEYSAPNHIEFWDALDYIGFEWYLPVTDQTDATIEELVAAAKAGIEQLARPVFEEYGKPLLFTEVGFEAKPYAWTRSYEGSSQENPYDHLAAAICYEYLFQAIEEYDFLEGMFIWSWQPAEITGDSPATFPKDLWWIIVNDGNEVQHSIVLPQISKWFHYYVD